MGVFHSLQQILVPFVDIFTKLMQYHTQVISAEKLSKNRIYMEASICITEKELRVRKKV